MGQDLFGTSWRSKLDQAAAALRALHKALIDATKRDYEKTHGKVQGPYALFSLVTQDPAFAWLQPMTRAIVEIEDVLARKEPAIGSEDFAAARGRVQALLTTAGESFADRYLGLLQSDPEIAGEHGRLQEKLRSLQEDSPGGGRAGDWRDKAMGP